MNRPPRLRHPLLAVAVALLVGGAALGCRGARQEAAVARYACPMHCEEERTYEQPQECPVCGMELIQVGADGAPLVPLTPPRGGAGDPS